LRWSRLEAKCRLNKSNHGTVRFLEKSAFAEREIQTLRELAALQPRSFLAGVELKHARDIIADVIDTMVRRLRPPFRSRSSRATPPSSMRSPTRSNGSVLPDAVEAAYFALRKHR
jgi:hypothetical protein